MTPSPSVDIDQIVCQLEQAMSVRSPIPLISGIIGPDSVQTAKRIQTRWNQLKVANGDRLVGYKIGLVSPSMREQYGLDHPDYGCLLESRRFSVHCGKVEVPLDLFLRPRLEAELAFLIGRPLKSGTVTAEDVIAAADAVALAAEVVDSRFADERICMVDTVADNASFGGFAIGEWQDNLLGLGLGDLTLSMRRNGKGETREKASEVLGNPIMAVAWLAMELRENGQELSPGDVVLSGSPSRALAVERGDDFRLSIDGHSMMNIGFV